MEPVPSLGAAGPGMGPVSTWGLPCFLGWGECKSWHGWPRAVGLTYHNHLFFFLFFIFLSCLNHCVLLWVVGLVWGGLFGMCSCLRCRLLAKSCLGWRVCKLGTGTAQEHHEQQLLNIRNPLDPPDPPCLLAPVCSRGDFMRSLLVFSQWYLVNTSCLSSPESSPCSLSQKKLAHRSSSCPNLSSSPEAGADPRDVALWGQQVFSSW